jgi:hypothetical protein
LKKLLQSRKVPVHPAVYESIEGRARRENVYAAAHSGYYNRFDRRMESAEDAVSKKRLESERVRMDVQNQNDSSLPIKHH